MFSLQGKFSFEYNKEEVLFNNHTINFKTDLLNSKNNLYGLIGPSGTGKTTLLSILGGQLMPLSGEITINSQNLYNLKETEARKLVAMQAQTSTSLRGSLKYNLLAGLQTKTEISLDQLLEASSMKNFTQSLQIFEDIGYSDEDLIKILEQVGLWSIFKTKDGLDTLIGEGGLNLSGGQRQRLNFANLYLRAKFFKPKLILADEPTSSLDEISEKFITDMILELSQDAVVLVVAHRLKTLEKALGLIDSSLFASNFKIESYSATELLKISEYYQDLLAGRAVLDD